MSHSMNHLFQTKRKAEQELMNAQADIEELKAISTQAEERAKDAINDAALMAEELKKVRLPVHFRSTSGSSIDRKLN